jgi:hypothetical protein
VLEWVQTGSIPVLTSNQNFMKLEKGTKVICIRNTFKGFKPTSKMNVAYPYLTVGKTYTVVMDFGTTLALIADNGNGISLLRDLFLTLEDYREKQIEKIFEKDLVD